MFYLDTNTCIYFLNGRYKSVRGKILGTHPSEITIPSIVKAELLLGAYKSKQREANLEKVERFLEPFKIQAFDDQAAYEYANIRYECESRGQLVGPNDLFIAAIVRYNNGVLVTNNIREFGRIPGLKLENWTEEH